MTLEGSYKAVTCMTYMNTTTGTRGHIDCGSLQTCDQSLSLRVIVRENRCARGGQTPGAAPHRPLPTGVARPMSLSQEHPPGTERAQ